ncbi:hypothetical protein OS493_022862 [Desmophyllum pertusum]|uniref:Fibronectin type-III domain-containing protein n=1 Tax=Desmophyllum pertusum TaxID=174260 RepID=A0A9W9ZM58_9CNID|nr:hypothetical protein OS493_022862 [Desmophyllum pertusum]
MEKPENCPKTTRRPITCSSSNYQCTDGTCVPLRYQCDGVRQCSDGSDEVGCGGGTPSTCPDFLCDSKTLCLPLSRRICWLQDFLPGCFSALCTRVRQLASGGHTTRQLLQCSLSAAMLRIRVQSTSPFKGSAPGPLSTTIKTTTLTASTSAPQNMQHVLRGDGSLQITWDAPKTTCRVVINYKIFYRQNTQHSVFQTIETGNVQAYRITGLAGGVTYEIKMQAFSVDGGGAMSDVQQVQIPIIPTQPTAPVTNPQGHLLMQQQ